MKTLTLSNPIQAHGKTISILEFREPTGNDITEAGLPFIFATDKAGNPTRQIDTRTMTALIAQLADVPQSSVKLMSFRDWQGAMGVVSDFLADTDTAKV